MHTLLALFMMAMPIAVPRNSPAPCADNDLTVTVRVHDYWQVSDEALSKASAIVTRMYGRIGVSVDWYPALKKGVRRPRAEAGGDPSRIPLAQITVIALTPEMAARHHMQEGVLGFAAVPEDGMGRIAYVIYDRVRQVASGDGADEATLLGMVMAHEISHLLLGRGSHADAGLMKDRWNHFEVRQLADTPLEFTEVQAAHIRRTIENVTRTAAAMAHERTPGSVEACVAAVPR